MDLRSAMTCAQCLKRVFRIDVETCQACGGAVKIIANIKGPVLIGKNLAHVVETAPVHKSCGCRGRVHCPTGRSENSHITRPGYRPDRDEAVLAAAGRTDHHYGQRKRLESRVETGLRVIGSRVFSWIQARVRM